MLLKNTFSGARDHHQCCQSINPFTRARYTVRLLHRSTRKLNLTEVGQVFLPSCQEMLAAERGKIRINEFRDDLVGDLSIATTPELGANHVIPALYHWLSAHRGILIER